MHKATVRRESVERILGESDRSSDRAMISPPTQVGGGTRKPAILSGREANRIPGREVVVRHFTRTLAIFGLLDVVVRRHRWPRRTRQCGSSYLQSRYWCWRSLPGGVSLCRADLVLGPGGRRVVGGLAADSIHDQSLRRWDGRWFLLGNLPDARQAVIGLGVVLGGSTVVVYVIPAHSASDLGFIPLEFAISWLAGFALRERAEKAEAAEVRATLAEREANAAARIAVAEERARIARELHDIVAHAVSVMVLQVGAVRHNLPEELAQDRDALRGVERAGRTALADMRGLLGAMRRDGDEAELLPQPGLDGLESLLQEIEPGRTPRPTACRRRAVPTAAGNRSVRLSNCSGGLDQRPETRPRA